MKISVLLRLSFCAALLSPRIPAVAAAPSDTIVKHGIRIVRCDQQIQSRKRGLCANHLNTADFPALAPGVSWWYDWYFHSDDRPPAGTTMEFLPMVWGDRAEDLAGLERYLSAGHRPRQILAINEPNLRGQAFIPPQQTAALYARTKAIADRYGIPVTGPQMALGSSPGDSNTANDPITGKTTYTFMIPFEKAFLHYAEKTAVRSTSLHSYGNVGELHWAVDLMHKEFHRPVWVTEYAHVPNQAEGLTYLIQATDFLERTPYVEGYAWFKERRSGDDAKLSLLQPEPGRLTPLGKAYVHMPVHDTDLYYRIPGRLQTERYVTLNKMEIWPTTDSDGFAQMSSEEAGGWTEYNLQVDRAGVYQLRIRVAGKPGSITILKGDQLLASVEATPTGTEWQTVAASVRLSTGTQTIRLRCGSKGQSLNWIEFMKP